MDEIDRALRAIPERRRIAEATPEPARSMLLAVLDREEAGLEVLSAARELAGG